MPCRKPASAASSSSGAVCGVGVRAAVRRRAISSTLRPLEVWGGRAARAARAAHIIGDTHPRPTSLDMRGFFLSLLCAAAEAGLVAADRLHEHDHAQASS